MRFTATDANGNATTTTSDFTVESAPDPEPEVTTFNVTVSNGKFYLNGVEAPSLDLTSGTEYTFNVNTSGHPFMIVDDNNVLIADPTETGSVSFTPVSGVSYEYKCQLHQNMGGTFTIID